jgi:hypothetical protein
MRVDPERMDDHQKQSVSSLGDQVDATIKIKL